jgi:hypothetical protein
MHELAVALNAAMEGTVAEAMLSPFGRRMYFPKGIIAHAPRHSDVPAGITPLPELR